MSFTDRSSAGQQLAEKLSKYKDAPDTLILALPRGGVVVAAPVAKTLNLPLDILVVRKIGAPGHAEFAIGAIAEPDEFIPNPDVDYDFDSPEVRSVLDEEKAELARRCEKYREGRERLSLKDKTIIFIDDGLATGTTMKVAIQAAKKEKPKKIVVAVPVSARDTASEIESLVDECLILEIPMMFMAVGQFYSDFPQNTDEEVVEVLREVDT